MLPVAMKCKMHGWPHYTGSNYGSSPLDHAANRAEVQLSSHTASQGQGWGQEHSKARAAEDQPQGCRTRRGSKGAEAEGKGMHAVLPGTKAQSPGGQAEPELGSSMEGEKGEREDSLLLFPQQ